MKKTSRWGFAGLGAVFLVALGVVLADAHADNSMSANAGNPQAAPVQPENIQVNPPPGINGAAVAQPVNMPSDPQQAAMVKRGEYLAVAGDCQYCHSVPGGPAYAGGQPVQTPFGDLITPNITPDRTYGIGKWSDAQFYNAVHNGIGVGHSLLVFPRYLYPVMPYQDYAKLSTSDVMAIRAYLNSIQPVPQEDRPSEMNFPFTLRAGMLAWRLLFFRDHPIQYDPSWSPQVRNGAFLVQALAHCSECHTPRNFLMATEPARYLGGGQILAQSWLAPNISSSKADGVGGWPAQALFQFLYRDGSLGVTGSPYGPMKEVVDESLSRLPASDIQDIVAYIQTATPVQHTAMPPARATVDRDNGAALYASNCARCHGGNGEGVNNNFPNLAGNQSLWNGPPLNAISMILGGFEPWHADQSNMPNFSQTLSDDQVAAIVNYINTSWGNRGTASATPELVASERAMTSDWASLSTGTTQASLTVNGASSPFDDISGRIEMFGHRDNCMLTGDFTADAPQAPVKKLTLYGNCAKGGSELLADVNIDGSSYPAKLSLVQYPSGLELFGSPAGSKAYFKAHIALVKPVEAP